MKSNAQRALESLRAEREEHAESVDTLRASLVGLRAVNDPTAEQERECAEVVARLATAERNLAGANTAIRVLEPVLADLQDAAIRIEGGIDRRTLDDRAGFTHFGEFVGAVANAARYRDRAVDERLMMPRAATGASEAVGADGGFLVPTAFSSEIARLSMSDTNYTTFCRTTPVTGNSMTFNSKNTTPWGASGLKAYWEGEGAPGQPTQPKFSRVTMTLNKLLGIAAVTNEMLADTTALEAELKQEFAEAVLWKTNSAVWEGTATWSPGPMPCARRSSSMASVPLATPTA